MTPISRRAVLLASSATAVAAAAGLPGPLRAQGAKIRVIVTPGISDLPLFAAQANGFFKKRNLDVEVVPAPTTAELRDGLAAGRYQIAHSAVDTAIAQVEASKQEVSVVIGGDNGFFALLVQPEIRTFADLKGKTLLVDAPSTITSLVAYKMLKEKGLAKGDYEVKQIGGSAQRLEAMIKDKTAAATLIGPPFSLRAERSGLRKLATAAETIGPFQSTAGWVMTSWGKANADVLTRYIQAYVQGLRAAVDPKSKEAASKLLASRLKLPLDIAADAWALAAAPGTGFARDARLDMDGLRKILQLRAELNNQWGGTPPAADKYVDLGYYEKAIAGLKAPG